MSVVLVSHWRFDEGSGTNAADSGPGNHPGTLIDGPTWEASAKVNSGAKFWGNDPPNFTQRIDLFSGHITSANDWSVSAWVRLDGTNLANAVFTSGDGTGANLSGILFGLTNGRVPRTICYVGTDSLGDCQSVAALTVGTFYHMVGVKNGTSVKNYINAVEDGSITVSSATMDYSGTAPLTLIGQRNDLATITTINGIIDELQFYEGALSLDQIAFLFNNPGSDIRGHGRLLATERNRLVI
jgi:Concanavalin A-like lectin/glucanases superfamily